MSRAVDSVHPTTSAFSAAVTAYAVTGRGVGLGWVADLFVLAILSVQTTFLFSAFF